MHLQSVLLGHVGPVNAVRWTRDGNYCLSCSDDRTVKLWNPHKTSTLSAATGLTENTAGFGRSLQIKSYSGAHGYAINDVAVYQDNSCFVSAGKDRTLFVWDVTSGAVVRRISAHSNVNALALNDVSSVVLSASYDQTVRVWDLRGQSRAGQAIQTLSDFRDSVTSVSIADGHKIIAGSVDGALRVYDLRMGLLHEDVLRGQGGQGGQGEPIVWATPTHNGKAVLSLRLATAEAETGGVHLHLTSLGSTQAQGKLLQSYPGGRHESYKAECCVLADDDKVAAGGEDGCVRVWSLQSGVLQSCKQSPLTPYVSPAAPREPPASLYADVETQFAGKARPHVCSVAAHPHLPFMLSAAHDGCIALWAGA